MLHHLRKRKTSFVLTICLLIALLTAATAYGFGRGAQGPDVYAVQGMLKSLGYFQGNITGTYGSETEKGVKLFQKAYGLPVTGAVDNRTLQSILWAYGNLKIPQKPAPTPAPEKAPTPAPAPEPAPVPNPGPETAPNNEPGSQVPEPSAEEKQMADLINRARAEAGLPALTVDPQLANTARLKSQDMADKNYFSHQSPTYGAPYDMLKRFGISYKTAGENIACNQTVEVAHQDLMNSQGHRVNILSKDFTHIGVGIVNGGSCGKMFTQQFIKK